MATGRRHKDIDDLFRDSLGEYPVEPSGVVRNELMRKVGRKEFMRFNPARFNVYYLSAAVAAAGLYLILSFSDISFRGSAEGDSSTIEPVLIEKQKDQPEVVTILPAEIIPDDTEVTGKTPGETRKTVAAPEPAERTETRVKQSYTVSIEPPKGIGIAQIITVTETTDLRSIRQVPVTEIKASAVEGCAPLLIKFQSTHADNEKMHWTSSDGRRSEARDVEWLFTQPGDYTITLRVTDKDGKEHYSSVGVNVHESPAARFDIAPVNRSISDREIMVLNYSEGALTSTWSFGDGEVSQLRDPVHVYRNAGSYRISLTVTNEYGCSDTSSLVYSTSVGGNRIDFPNAFIPNKNGPTGGFYSPRSDEAAYVFHPEYEGVTGYHLIVYSRTGAVLFESRNINIGWDGYYKGQLCEPGVYVWRARGRFDNGDEFSRTGDVTLLRF